MDKVYCNKCKYRRRMCVAPHRFNDYCTERHTSNERSDYINGGTINNYILCETLNSNGNCRFYDRKLSIIEKIKKRWNW